MDNLPVDQIKLDEEIQSRAALDYATIAEYANAMRAGDSFPPVTVFFDGSAYWLADGFHRVKAAQAVGLQTIAADIRQGKRRAAVLFSVGANAKHGLRRTNEDKRRSVLTLLNDSEWSRWNDSEIARQTQTSHTFVAKLRAHLETLQDGPRLVRRGDSVYEMNRTGPLSLEEKNRRAVLENKIGEGLKELDGVSKELEAVMTAAAPEVAALRTWGLDTIEDCLFVIDKAEYWQNTLAAGRLKLEREMGKALKDINQ